MKNDAQKLLLLELLDRLSRSWWTLVAGICVGAALSVVALHFTKPIYMAEATIEADVERLPAEFVRRTVSDNVELQLGDLRQAVLSDENLRQVITTAFGTPTSESQAEALADRIYSNIKLQFSSRDLTIGVRYTDQVPARAARVTNLLAELFVQENKGLRAVSARRVRESIESLASEGDQELEQKKMQLNELLSKHPHELESQRRVNEQTIDRLLGELDETDKAIRAAERRLRVLEAQHSLSLVSGTGTDPETGAGPAVGNADAQIIQIEQEIERLLINLTENHPDVVAKRRELERLRAASRENAVAEGLDPDAAEKPPETQADLPSLDIWQTRLRAANLETERLEDRKEEIRQELDRYRRFLTNTPVIQQQVDDLRARVEVLQQTYMDNQRKIETARTGQRLEEEDIANPFVVTRFAGIPTIPVWPNRLMFVLAGVAGGLLLFAGPVLAKAFLKPTILSEASLGLLADVPLLVTIPVIQTAEVARLRRRATLKNFVLSALAVGIAAGVAAMQYVGVI